MNNLPRLVPIPGSPFAQVSQESPHKASNRSNGLNNDYLQPRSSDLQDMRIHQRGVSLPLPSNLANDTTSSLMLQSISPRSTSEGLPRTGFGKVHPVASGQSHTQVVAQDGYPHYYQDTSGSPQLSHSQTSATSNTAQPSRADTSNNWRQKSHQDQPAVADHPYIASETPNSNQEQTTTDVMTIDNLFAKFEKVRRYSDT